LAHERILDASKLDPPAPLSEALAAADTLRAGEYIRMKVNREPLLLYPLLVSQGFSHVCHAASQSGFEVFIWRSDDEDAEVGVRAVLRGIDDA